MSDANNSPFTKSAAYGNDLYASIGRRLLGFFLDALILVLPTLLANSILPLLGGVLIWFFYGPVLESSELRATIGKHLVGIQVTDEMGRRISLRAAVVRNLLKVISTVLLFVGFFFALFTRRKQALHDMLADTYVVYGRCEQPIADVWLASVKDTLGSFGLTSGGAKPPKMSQETPGAGGDAESTVTQLERLQALREKGAINEEEFQAAKRKLLGEGGSVV
jgi:uncharacterized RDD family membrane protein YckC